MPRTRGSYNIQPQESTSSGDGTGVHLFRVTSTANSNSLLSGPFDDSKGEIVPRHGIVAVITKRNRIYPTYQSVEVQSIGLMVPHRDSVGNGYLQNSQFNASSLDSFVTQSTGREDQRYQGMQTINNYTIHVGTISGPVFVGDKCNFSTISLDITDNESNV